MNSKELIESLESCNKDERIKGLENLVSVLIANTFLKINETCTKFYLSDNVSFASAKENIFRVEKHQNHNNLIRIYKTKKEKCVLTFEITD